MVPWRVGRGCQKGGAPVFITSPPLDQPQTQRPQREDPSIEG